jgi:nitrogen fixation protein FixH
MEREITGRMVLAGMVGAFGIIIAVNLTMAYLAIGTFPGLETRNSYVASQQFQAARDAQVALGWTAKASYQDGQLRIDFTGPNGVVNPATLDATLGRATRIDQDIAPDFQFDGRGHVATVQIAPGYWNVRLDAWDVDGTRFRQRLQILVPAGD